MSTVFTGERVRLTAIADEDLPWLAGWLSDFGLQRLVNPGMSMPNHETYLLNPDGWFQADLKSEKARLFAVRTVTDDLFIGVTALSELNMFTHCAEIGINLGHPDYRGRGYGAETMLLTMRYGFEQFNLNRIRLRVMSYNSRAIRLYERLGFVHEVQEREALFHDGLYFDQLFMGILRAEWETIHG